MQTETGTNATKEDRNGRLRWAVGACVGPITTGGWWDMGILVDANMSYPIQGFNNASCTTGPGTLGSLVTPSAFAPNCHFCWSNVWRCVNTCSQTACP